MSKTKGNSDKKIGSLPGRPKSKYGDKKPRSIYLSGAAHESLKMLAGECSAKNLSEFLEKLGHGEILLKSPDSDSLSVEQGLVEQQLYALIQNPHGGLCSLLAFTLRLASQLGLPQEREFIHHVMLDAMVALYYVDYLAPAHTVDSVIAWLRWYILHALKNRAENEPHLRHQITPSITYRKIDGFTGKCIGSIHWAMKELMKGCKAVHLYAFSLRMRPNVFDMYQIHKVCSAQDVSETGFELVNKGMLTFRNLFLKARDINEEIDLSTKAFIKVVLNQAVEYCDLMQEATLSDKEFKSLKRLIVQGLYRPDYDCWASEIDYLMGCKTCTDKEAYEEETKALTMLIAGKLKNRIRDERIKINRKIMQFREGEDQLKQAEGLLTDEVMTCLGYQENHDLAHREKILKEVIQPLEPGLSLRKSSSHPTKL